MNPVVAAAAVKAGKEAGSYASRVGQAVIDSPEDRAKVEERLKLPKGSIQKMAEGKEDPKLSTVIGIADILGTNLDKLTGYVNKNAERARQGKNMRQSLNDLNDTLTVLGEMDKSEEADQVINYTKDAVNLLIERSEQAKPADRAIVLRNGMRNLSMRLDAIESVRDDAKVKAITGYTRTYIKTVLDDNKTPEEQAKANLESAKQESQNKAEQNGLFSGFDMSDALVR